MAFQKDPNEIGILWRKQGQKGEYFTGVINDVKVVIFETGATSEKAPTHRVLKSVPREGAPTREER